ncbi:MAG TPA: DUF3237 domain-containing protein [Bryobacteraceae bacterium]|nr:DUF3237 domain-containing protein [Bryobacteraceae bacterium]
MPPSDAPAAPALEFVFEVLVEIGAPLDLGQTPQGRRRVIPITGGRFEGPALRGRVLPGGADWQILFPDGAAALDARYTLETERGSLISVSNRGMRHGPPEVLRKLNAGEFVDPRAYYFRTTALFETGAEECDWLTRSIFLGVGQRYPEKVTIRFWRVL